MRNLAIVALTDAGRRVDEVARVFDLTATYVSMLRGRARLKGSAGLVRRRGRPRKLSDRQVAQARAWAGSGWTQQAISERLGVARSVIGDLLARVGPAPMQDGLPDADAVAVKAEPGDTHDAHRDQGRCRTGHRTGGWVCRVGPDRHWFTQYRKSSPQFVEASVELSVTTLHRGLVSRRMPGLRLGRGGRLDR